MELGITKYSQREMGETTAPETLAEVYCYLPTKRLRLELEQFRVAYEADHGETDLTLRYSSALPTVSQMWLLENHPLRYYNALPPFVRSFILDKMRKSTQEGTLDDMPAAYIRLFLSGQLGDDTQRGGR